DASISRSRNRRDWIADTLPRGAIPRVSQVPCRRLLRQQRDAILLLFGEDPDPAHGHKRRSVARAQRRARDNPLPALSPLPVFRILQPHAPRGLAPWRRRRWRTSRTSFILEGVAAPSD